MGFQYLGKKTRTPSDTGVFRAGDELQRLMDRAPEMAANPEFLTIVETVFGLFWEEALDKLAKCDKDAHDRNQGQLIAFEHAARIFRQQHEIFWKKQEARKTLE